MRAQTDTINYKKGIGGVNIGSTRGQISKFLGAPQTTTKFTEPGVSGRIYEADYTDDALSVRTISPGPIAWRRIPVARGPMAVLQGCRLVRIESPRPGRSSS